MRRERWHTDSPIWLAIGTKETVRISGDEYSGEHAYGCLHCPVRIDANSGAIRWYKKMDAVKEHIQKE
jgi:hypothetical protein